MRKSFLPRHRSRKQNNDAHTNVDGDDFFLQNFDFSNHSIPVTSSGGANQFAGDDNTWMNSEFEGQLSVDVYQKDDAIIVKSTIAGVKPEDLEISVENDMLTIRGKRHHDHEVQQHDYFFQECYWGGFSRSIILPVDVQFDKIQAELDNGVLTIMLPKASRSKKVDVHIKE